MGGQDREEMWEMTANPEGLWKSHVEIYYYGSTLKYIQR